MKRSCFEEIVAEKPKWGKVSSLQGNKNNRTTFRTVQLVFVERESNCRLLEEDFPSTTPKNATTVFCCCWAPLFPPGGRCVTSITRCWVGCRGSPVHSSQSSSMLGRHFWRILHNGMHSSGRRLWCRTGAQPSTGSGRIRSKTGDAMGPWCGHESTSVMVAAAAVFVASPHGRGQLACEERSWGVRHGNLYC